MPIRNVPEVLNLSFELLTERRSRLAGIQYQRLDGDNSALVDSFVYDTRGTLGDGRVNQLDVAWLDAPALKDIICSHQYGSRNSNTNDLNQSFTNEPQ